jgi:hypothetical protein
VALSASQLLLNEGGGRGRRELTRLTASSQAFLSSVRLALFTFTTSLSSGGMTTDRGPVGLSGDEGGRSCFTSLLERSSVDVDIEEEPFCAAVFFERAMREGCV